MLHSAVPPAKFVEQVATLLILKLANRTKKLIALPSFCFIVEHRRCSSKSGQKSRSCRQGQRQAVRARRSVHRGQLRCRRCVLTTCTHCSRVGAARASRHRRHWCARARGGRHCAGEEQQGERRSLRTGCRNQNQEREKRLSWSGWHHGPICRGSGPSTD